MAVGGYHRRMALEPPMVFPDLPEGEPITVSASLFMTFERCPEQAAGRLRGRYSAESRMSFVGGLAHRVFARHLSEGPVADADFTQVCREEIGSSMNPKLGALGLKPSELGRVISEVGELYERFRTLGSEGFAGAEVSLEFEPADGVLLRGRVDAVFDEESGSVRLVDWKTGSLGEPETQLAFYALLWALEREEIPGRVEAVSVKSGERMDEVPSRAGIDALAVRVAEAITVLRSSWETEEPLERIAGPWCRWCPLLDECSEGSAAVSLLGS